MSPALVSDRASRKKARPERPAADWYFSYRPLAAVGGSHYGRSAFARDLAKLGLSSTRHKTLFHVAANAGALIAGGELDELSAVVTLEASGRRLGLPESEIRRTVKDGIAKGMLRPRRADESGVMLKARQDAQEAVLAWWQTIQAQDWSARSGATTLKILAGFAVLASASGKIRVTQSYREIAEAAGVAVGTVSKHEKHWSKFVAVVQKGSRLGFERVERTSGQRTNRSVFQLLVTKTNGNRPEAVGKTAMAGLFPTFPRKGTLSDPACDRWHRSAGMWRLWSTLDPVETCLVKGLAAALGRRPDSVRRTLALLAAEGLVSSDGAGGWVRVETKPPATMTPYGQLRRERHRRDRASFASYLSARGLHVRYEPVVNAA